MSESKYFFTGDLIKSNIEKIPRFEKGEIRNDAMFPTFDMFSEIDEIVKDIQEKKDNAMAMEFTKCIGELLRNNGVVPKLTEYSGISQTDKTFETRYGVTIDDLDFSEHDKVFEDKIASLEENVGYYKDSLSRVEKNCDKLYHENKELKQRIAELESKEDEKSTKYTTVIVAKEINGQEYVKLNDFMSVMNDFQAEIGT